MIKDIRMMRFIFLGVICFLISPQVQATGTKYFVASVQGDGELALKAAELDKLFCLAGTKVAEKKKESALCVHEVKAMMQHFAMTQSLGIKSGTNIQGPDYYYHNAQVIFRAFLEMGQKKDATPTPVLRIQYLRGGNPPVVVKEQAIPLSRLPKDHELSFMQDVMLALLMSPPKTK
jgi:hypothetical protein